MVVAKPVGPFHQFWRHDTLWLDSLICSCCASISRRDDVSFFALATREDDVLFSSFVNAVVVATIYALEEDITNITAVTGMPTMSIFGNQFNWALK